MSHERAEEFARNRRFSGHSSAIITECPDGYLALHAWGGCGDLLYVGQSIEELRAAFLTRPAYTFTPRPAKPLTAHGITLDDLEIDI